MAANYPASFDAMSDPAANLSGPPTHATMHNQINDVIEALEQELGLNPSGTSATVAALLAALQGVTDATFLAALALRYAPFGAARVVGKASAAAASASSANATPVVTGLAVTVPVVAGRAYRIDSSHNLTMASGASPNYAQVLHFNGANVSLFQIKPGAVGVYLTQVVSSYFVAGSTGNVTVTIYFSNPIGGTSVQDYADGTALRYLFVTEIG